jgi:hypothetical protein
MAILDVFSAVGRLNALKKSYLNIKLGTLPDELASQKYHYN